MAERDDLGFLRRAWSEVAPPTPDESIDSPDPETQRVLDYVRAAWGVVQPPPAHVPWRLRGLPRLLRLHRRKAVWTAAAALVLAPFGASLLVREDARPVELSGVDEPRLQPTSERSDPLIASIAHDRTEIRSGPVRLILFSQDLSDVSTSKEAR